MSYLKRVYLTRVKLNILKMTKYFHLIALLVVVIFNTNAQGEKIKGNRNVTVKQTYVDDFSTLIIKNDFEVNLAYNSLPSIEIETDDNLHEVIDLESNDGILSISTNRRITSKRKLIITVNYAKKLNDIQLEGEAELRSLTSMELETLNLKTIEDSRAYLNVKASSFGFTASDKSKSRLNVVADSTQFILSDNTSLEALVTSKSSKFDIYQRAEATVEGDSETANFRIDNSGQFYGKDFIIKDANLKIEGSSDASLFVENLLTLEASGTSEIFVYGDAKFNLKSFLDSAKLQKKDISDKGLF